RRRSRSPTTGSSRLDRARRSNAFRRIRLEGSSFQVSRTEVANMKKKTLRVAAALLLMASAALGLGAGWMARTAAAQTAATPLKKDFINPTPGRFSGAVVVHG